MRLFRTLSTWVLKISKHGDSIACGKSQIIPWAMFNASPYKKHFFFFLRQAENFLSATCHCYILILLQWISEKSLVHFSFSFGCKTAFKFSLPFPSTGRTSPAAQHLPLHLRCLLPLCCLCSGLSSSCSTELNPLLDNRHRCGFMAAK